MIVAVLLSSDGVGFVGQFELPVTKAPLVLFAQIRHPATTFAYANPALSAALQPQMKFERFREDDLSMKLLREDGRIAVYRQVAWPPVPA
jgi:hypothetical protein